MMDNAVLKTLSVTHSEVQNSILLAVLRIIVLCISTKTFFLFPLSSHPTPADWEGTTPGESVPDHQLGS